MGRIVRDRIPPFFLQIKTQRGKDEPEVTWQVGAKASFPAPQSINPGLTTSEARRGVGCGVLQGTAQHAQVVPESSLGAAR